MRRQFGFTLIELLLTMVIIGILAAIAIPSYQGYVERSYRADAQAELLETAQRLERRYSQTFSFVDTGGAASPVIQVPESGDARYLIDIAIANSGSTYTLSAVPKGAQADDECGTLWLQSNGSKVEPTDGDENGDDEETEAMLPAVSIEDCW